MRRWPAGAAAWVGVLLVGVPTTWATELRALETAQSSDATTITLHLSDPVRAAVSAVEAEPGKLARLYVDLPVGTHIGRGVARANTGPGERIGAIRIGVGDGGGPRIAIDLETVAAYHVSHAEGGRVVIIGVSGPHPAVSAATPAPAKDPRPAARVRRAARIVIDPGHGGHDPGAQGFAVEKDVTLSIARRLTRLLRERLQADPVLTRTDDSTLALADRTARANAEGADLFVSIHANASENTRLHGIETYYLNNTDDRATIRLASLENGLDLLHPAAGATDLRYILSDLVQVGKMDDSIALATALQRSLVRRLRDRYADVTDLGVKQGPFYVLVGAYMPCVLVETSFLSHRVEGRRMGRGDYQQLIAEGLYAGIARFLADSARARTL